MVKMLDFRQVNLFLSSTDAIPIGKGICIADIVQYTRKVALCLLIFPNPGKRECIMLKGLSQSIYFLDDYC